jgi:hypothetical protein
LDLIKIPTLHLHGTTDENYANGGRQLANYYDPDCAKLLEIKYHHAMPFKKYHVEPFVAMVRALSRDPTLEFEEHLPRFVVEGLEQLGPGKWRAKEPEPKEIHNVTKLGSTISV